MEHQANTVWLKAYTPSGFQVGITIGFQDGKLPLAVDVEAMVTGAGYLIAAPGLEVGEDAEEILYICRVNKSGADGTKTPHIAFYPAAPQLKMRFCHEYLNDAQQIADFENATGLTLASIPIAPSLPQYKDDEAFAPFVVKLVKPIRIARDVRQKGDDKKENRLKRYVDTIGKPPAPSTTATEDSGQQTTGTGSPAKPADNQHMQAPDENTWKRWVFEATRFLYTADGKYNEHQHRNSLKKRMEDTTGLGIDATMTLYEVLNRLIRYRALHDLFLDTSDYPKIFGISFEDYVDKHGHVATWQRMNDYYAAQLEPAKPKAN